MTPDYLWTPLAGCAGILPAAAATAGIVLAAAGTAAALLLLLVNARIGRDCHTNSADEATTTSATATYAFGYSGDDDRIGDDAKRSRTMKLHFSRDKMYGVDHPSSLIPGWYDVW